MTDLQNINRFFNKGNIRSFIAGMVTATIILVIYNRFNITKNKVIIATKQLSFCEKLDLLTHEQTRGFKNIKGKAFLNSNDTIWYRSTINFGEDSSVMSLNENHKFFFRGYITTQAKNDPIYLAKFYDSLKSAINVCLPKWEKYELNDISRRFPFTRFIKDSTQIELYYLKNGYDSMYTFGLVVEDIK